MKRYFEFIGADSSRASGQAEKFWEISVSKADVTVRFGKIGANGQTTLKSLPDVATALREVEKLIAEKLKKGYSEVSRQTTAQPSAKKGSKTVASKALTQREIVSSWLAEFGICAGIDAEVPDHLNPVQIGWKLDQVWTWWDSYDEAGSYATPGYDEKREVEGDRFVAGWLLGTKSNPDPDALIVIVDRRTCESCEMEGCDECDDLGWVETNHLSDLGFILEWATPVNSPLSGPNGGRQSKASANQEASSTLNCVACAEAIKANAKLCKHCGTMQDDPRFVGTADLINAESEQEDQVEGDYELTEMDNLCTDAMVHLNQLVENENLERVHFVDKKQSIILSASFEDEVIDVEFPEKYGRKLKSFTPEDDEDYSRIKHVYLEPDDFFDFDQEDTGFALLQELFELAGCESVEDVRAENVLRNKRGSKPFYLIPKMK